MTTTGPESAEANGTPEVAATAAPDANAEGQTQQQPVGVPTPTAATTPPPYGYAAAAHPWPPLPPRQRWIAPDKRKFVIGISTAAALVIFGLGMVAGRVTGDHHRARFMPMNGYSQFGPNMRRGMPGFGQFGDDGPFGRGFNPPGPGQQSPQPNRSASPAPTS